MDLLAIFFGGTGFGLCAIFLAMMLGSDSSPNGGAVIILLAATAATGWLFFWGLIRNHKSHTRK